MKVIALNGSPREKGNTFTVLQVMSEELAAHGIDTEIINVGGELIHGCIACGYCHSPENQSQRCVFDDDPVNTTAEKMREANGLILGSPVYYGGIAGTMKAFLDRAFYTSSSHFRNKIGTAVVAVRRSGGVDAFNQLNNYLRLSRVISPPSKYWGVVHGRAPGEVLKDLEGIQTVRWMVRDMAWLLKTLDSAKNIPSPDNEEKIMTSFIR